MTITISEQQLQEIENTDFDRLVENMVELENLNNEIYECVNSDQLEIIQ